MKSENTNPVYANKQGRKLVKQKYDINASAQRTRLLSWLRKQPITTLQARKELDILGVAPRIYELRHIQNFNIVTHWCYEATQEGTNHRVAKYILQTGKFKEKSHDIV